MHVSRGGQLAPSGDYFASSSETQAALEQAVRERAYFLWEQDGRPLGNAEKYWDRALEQHLLERAYALWEQEGAQKGVPTIRGTRPASSERRECQMSVETRRWLKRRR
jgi:hypothetical protein